MRDLDPTNRFTGLAEQYAQHRPTYPAKALDFILEQCSLRPGALVVDVGSGTGISSRLLAERGLQVIGIEPNAEMRSHAAVEPLAPGVSPPRYLDGRAEATGLPDASADAVLSAQAFHWFDPEAALREFHRILKPAGWAILVWNEREESDPFTAAYGVVIRTSADAAAVEGNRHRAGEPLLASPLFRMGSRVVFPHAQELDEAGVLGRAFSASYAPREPAAAEAFAARLCDVFRRFQRDGKVVLRYETSVYTAQRAGTLVRPLPG